MNNALEAEFMELLDNVSLESFVEKDVLVSGASGNLMSYLVSFLEYGKKNGVKVGKIHLVSASGIFPKSMIISDQTRVHVGDLTNLTFLQSLPSCDILIHAAGYAQPQKFSEVPIKTFLLNSPSTYYLSTLVRDGGKLLFLSSSEVYSGLSMSDHLEDKIGVTGPSHQRACYIQGKIGGETVVEIERKEGRIEAFSARVSLIYGPGFRLGDKRVLNTMIESALLQRKIKLLDSGSAIRTYCYIADAVKQLLAILNYGNDSTYNVGGISRTSIKELALLIAEKTSSRVEFGGDEQAIPGAPKEVKVNIQKVLGLTSSYSFVPLDTGIQRTLDWFVHEL